MSKKNSFYAGVCFADRHAPYHDKKAIDVLCKVISDVKPSVLIDLGDGGEFESISRFNQGKPLLQEGERIVKDIEALTALDTIIFSALPNKDKVKKVKLIGNHEERLERYVEFFPAIQGIFPDYKRGDKGTFPDLYGRWDVVIPHGKFYAEGKLMFHHGDRLGYQSIHHAKQWASMGKNIVYGHRHDIQRYTHEKLSISGTPECSAAFSIGCLCSLERDWRVNQRTTWQQGFSVFYIRDGGLFSFYHVDIIKGKAVWNNKIYEGK